MFKLLITSLLLLIMNLSWAQHVDESVRISELYDLIPDKSALYGQEVLIYDYKLKGKRTIKDSVLVARISVLNQIEEQHKYSYDTNGLEIIKYELIENDKKAVQKMVYDEQLRIIESSVINEQLEPLSKVFYTYNADKLISEEAFTGYAYLDEPRKLSLITYTYQGDQLVQRDKKYSLNGTHWVQTWVTKYNELGQVIWQEETNQDYTYTADNIYKNGRLQQSQIVESDQKPSIMEITYNSKGYPTSVYRYTQKKKKAIRLTKYFYIQS